MIAPRDEFRLSVRANAAALNSDDLAERERAMTRIEAAAERYAGNRYAPDVISARREAAVAEMYGRRDPGNHEERTENCA